ncbi:alanine racemase C-terminal domain-containing protein [Microbacterium hydrocarbonoxydans]|uniref:alanine racemase C-terminal domain-containing protein n=1 Tax=Microbacterium hydrocarbonoxydans TaxID=273678 RepID=UPI0007BB2765|nr:alanine racemase C-terminal domain-containing protein [Microbacterium hydrocarbonoxydans]GAT73259.1 alanine racemase [Microbacterium sp. HM58-2]
MCDTTSSARPRAIISRSALTAAAAAAVADGGTVADLRRDAWGHGVLGVAQTVAAAGVCAALVDTPLEAEMLRLEGIAAVTDGVPDIDPLLLYGLPDQDGMLRTRPVMRLAGRVLSIKKLKAGDAVSYGYTHRAAQDTVVALVTGGYAQGIVRALGNEAHVEVAGSARPIVGRVAMDVCVVDLENEDVAVDSEVTYFGGTGPAGPALARWSAVTGLSVAELVTVAGAHAARGWEA